MSYWPYIATRITLFDYNSKGHNVLYSKATGTYLIYRDAGWYTDAMIRQMMYDIHCTFYNVQYTMYAVYNVQCPYYVYTILIWHKKTIILLLFGILLFYAAYNIYNYFILFSLICSSFKIIYMHKLFMNLSIYYGDKCIILYNDYSWLLNYDNH